MYFAVVNYPKIPEGARESIAFIREKYPSLDRDPVPPYITLVAPNNKIDQGVLLGHVEYIAKQFGPIPFALRCAMPVWDDTTELTYIYLPPDEGFSKITLLHNALYTGPLESFLRLNVPYIPRITLGYTEDTVLGKQIADHLNSLNFEIRGVVDSIGILALHEGRFETVAHVYL